MPITKKSNQVESEGKKVDYEVRVSKVREIKDRADNYRFNLNVNGVDIYGMTYVTYTDKDGKKKSFCSFPSYKGKDDKYYNICWFSISESLFDEIEEQIARCLSNE